MTLAAVPSPQSRTPRWLINLVASLAGWSKVRAPRAAHRGHRAVWRPF
jgi:hypothetical protein